VQKQDADSWVLFPGRWGPKDEVASPGEEKRRRSRAGLGEKRARHPCVPE